ncbi:MAG: hypothetical protein HeimC2_11210 [Candidatus Heimdallarchaeota archaeon LC_2]|nr:MAG: hypothetical protein HeimC2_11210 [Candidatus Heimdallarchaeota archaeon LC_2]
MRIIKLIENKEKKVSLDSVQIQELSDYISNKSDSKMQSSVALKQISATQVFIHPKNVVGSIGLTNARIVIAPKFYDQSKVILDAIALTGRLSNLRIDHFDEGVFEKYSFLDLIFTVLVEQCQYLIKHGILKSYVNVTERMNFVRGKLLLKETYLQNYGLKRLVVCSIDDITTNIFENKVILHTIQIGLRTVSSNALKNRLITLYHKFNEVCDVSDIELPINFDPMEYTSKNYYYKDIHQTIKWILENLTMKDYEKSGERKYNFTWLLDTSILFEEIIEILLRNITLNNEWHLETQYPLRGIYPSNASKSHIRRNASPRLDAVIQNSIGASLIIDMKYKQIIGQTISTGDIYQMISYNHMLREDNFTSMMIYPLDNEDIEGLGNKLIHREEIILQHHNNNLPIMRIIVVALSISKLIKELMKQDGDRNIHETLKQYIADYFQSI